MKDTTPYTELPKCVWQHQSKLFLKSFLPSFSDDYPGDVCWHGCDKVSRMIKACAIDKYGAKIYMMTGGGGS